MFIDLQSEITYLHLEIKEKRAAFIDGLKKDSGFKELRNIYQEHKVLVVRLGECCKQQKVE
jgi:hypothetical protein